MALNNFTLSLGFYICGFYSLRPCRCIPVSQMVPRVIPPRFTSVSSGDEGWVFIGIRCRGASDGLCGRVLSVFVSFSGLHEPKQYRCVVDVVSILVIALGAL